MHIDITSSQLVSLHGCVAACRLRNESHLADYGLTEDMRRAIESAVRQQKELEAILRRAKESPCAL